MMDVRILRTVPHVSWTFQTCTNGILVLQWRISQDSGREAFLSIPAGQQLRGIRERLGLTLRDVEAASSAIAKRHGNSDFSVSLSRLSEIETKGMTTNIFRVYSLSAIYRVDYREVFAMCGIEWDSISCDIMAGDIRKTHKISALNSTGNVDIPLATDPRFDTLHDQSRQDDSEVGNNTSVISSPLCGDTSHVRLLGYGGFRAVPTSSARFIPTH
jgi:transcriptional regulator with XRE-family HTH domain